MAIQRQRYATYIDRLPPNLSFLSFHGSFLLLYGGTASNTNLDLMPFQYKYDSPGYIYYIIFLFCTHPLKRIASQPMLPLEETHGHAFLVFDSRTQIQE